MNNQPLYSSQLLTRRDLLRCFSMGFAALSFSGLHEPTASAASPQHSRDRELLRTMEIPISEEELERRFQEVEQGCKLYTTAEVLAHLRGLSSC